MISTFVSFLRNDCLAIQSLLEAKEVTEPQTIRTFHINLNTFWESSEGIDILHYMNALDFNIALLEDVIGSYRFDFEADQIQYLIEIVRMLEVLGAGDRLQEYALVLHYMLNKIKMEEWLPYAGRIPVSFDRLANSFYQKYPIDDDGILMVLTANICALGSKRLLLYRSNLPFFDVKDIFLSLCNYGHFDLAKEFDRHNEYWKTLHPLNLQLIFQATCKYGRLDIAQNLYAEGEINIHYTAEEPFRLACEHGHLLVCQWLYTLGNVNIHANYEYAFIYACSNGHILVAKWLLSIDAICIQSDQLIFCGEIFKYQTMEDFFYEYGLIEQLSLSKLLPELCLSGNLLAAKRLYQRFYSIIDIHDNNDRTFICACYSGNIELAQWIYSLGDVNIHCHNDRPFIKACESNLELAQWIYSFGEVNIHADYDQAFSNACLKGHLDIAQWLYYEIGVGKVNIHASQDEAFHNGISKGHIHIVQWLYSLGGFEMIKMMMIACDTDKKLLRCGHLLLAQWIHHIMYIY
jgi:hypothetical protein